MTIVTIADRNARAVERLRKAGMAVRAELEIYGAEHGVRFSIFGSFARDELVPDSDFDVMVDGPEALMRAARDAAEMICENNGLRPDVYVANEVSSGLMLRIARDGIVLP